MEIIATLILGGFIAVWVLVKLLKSGRKAQEADQREDNEGW